MPALPAARGALFALLAALLFGASTPLVQRAGAGVGSWMTAALLYAGAALAGVALRASAEAEARLQRQHWPRLAQMALCGAVLGPAALAWGLQHTSGVGASLMLTLEAVFTTLLAWLLYREQVGQRVVLALVLLTLGGAVLVLGSAPAGAQSLTGLLAVMAATVLWGIDNSLSRPLADIDPGAVVLGKAAMGSAGSLVLALLLGQTTVAWVPALGLVAIGAVGYGLSLRCYLLAQRSFGAARTASVFAAAPFIGALLAFGLGERSISLAMGTGLALMAAGVLLHVGEQHDHDHRHNPLTHDHAHNHDDGHHHDHPHGSCLATPPQGTHSHPHSHQATLHSHPHTPDLHHGHQH